MSGRSSARSVLVLALVAAPACGKKAAPPPAEADPAKVAALAAQMLQDAPPIGAPTCKDGELHGGVTLTYNTLLRLGGKPVANDPEHSAWLNPPELDAPEIRTLLDGGATPAARQAAATVLAAPFLVVYRIDNVDAPLAIGVKELKIGTVGARAIRYDLRGRPTCVVVFLWQNTKAKSDWAIAASDKTLVDPAVAQALQADLREQYLAHAPR
jgi:hypothetical protein